MAQIVIIGEARSPCFIRREPTEFMDYNVYRSHIVEVFERACRG